ncbi:MAG TPA: DUF6445 family protein [Sphingomonas sp.]
MPTSIMIVDDFLPNPAAVRDAALHLTYPDLQGNFPGRNSLQRLEMSGLAQEVSRLVGEPLKPVEPMRSHGKCRAALARDSGLAHVHIDDAHWSGILYLSRPEDCRGGTEFFRHKPTGTDCAPRDQAEARALGFDSPGDAAQRILERDSVDADKWELTMQVPMRFNRLVLLRPWLWHTAGPAFGDTLENGRLIYLMFFASAR